MDYNLWFEEALVAVKSVKIGQVFVLRDLFEGHRWNSLTVGDLLGFGGYFKKKVLLGKVPGIVYFGKAANDSAQYIKKTEEAEK